MPVNRAQPFVGVHTTRAAREVCAIKQIREQGLDGSSLCRNVLCKTILCETRQSCCHGSRVIEFTGKKRLTRSINFNQIRVASGNQFGH